MSKRTGSNFGHYFFILGLLAVLFGANFEWVQDYSDATRKVFHFLLRNPSSVRQPHHDNKFSSYFTNDLEEELRKSSEVAIFEFNSLGVGSSFDCLEEEATCKIVKALGDGGFGAVYQVEVHFKPAADGDKEDRQLLSREAFLKEAIDRANTGIGSSKGGNSSQDSNDAPVVALKIFNYTEFIAEKEFSSFDISFKLSLLEAMTLIELPTHPNIVDIYHVEILFGTIFIYVELVPGATLENTVRAKSMTNVSTLLSLTYQIASGIEFLHSLKIHHFDMKAANIMIKDASKNVPVVKIVDFGMAHGKATGFSSMNKPMCSPGGGTKVYNSPMYESWRKTKLGPFCFIDDSNLSTSITTADHPCCSAHDNWALGLNFIILWSGRVEVVESIKYMKANNISHYYSSVEALADLISGHKVNPNYPDMPPGLVERIYPMVASDHQNRSCSLKYLIDYLEEKLGDSNDAVKRVKFDEKNQLSDKDYMIKRSLNLGESIMYAANSIFDTTQRMGLLMAAEHSLSVGLSYATRPADSSFETLRELYQNHCNYLRRSSVHYLGVPPTATSTTSDEKQSDLPVLNIGAMKVISPQDKQFYKVYYLWFSIYNSLIRDEIIRDIQEKNYNSSNAQLDEASFDLSNYNVSSRVYGYMVKAVKFYRNFLVYDLQHSDNSKSFHHHIDFLICLRYLSSSSMLSANDRADILETFNSPKRTRLTANELILDNSSTGNYSYAYNESDFTTYVIFLFESLSLDIQSSELSLRNYLEIIPGSKVMLKDPSSKHPCLSGKEIGSIITFDRHNNNGNSNNNGDNNNFKVIGPKLKICSIEKSFLKLSRMILINSRVTLANEEISACGLGKSEFGILMEVNFTTSTAEVQHEGTKKVSSCSIIKLIEA